MPVSLTWQMIAVRLFFTMIGGAAIGVNRGERGRSAGLRTTLLVCLAASVAMIQANLLMSSTGKSSDSFVVLDLMRLPLGILSGMGFIGAGAILRRGSLAFGVTTAATLWFVTVMGLCFGGGQIGLGLAMTGLGLFVLWALRWVEWRMHQDRQGALPIKTEHGGPDESEIRLLLCDEGYQILSCSLVQSPALGETMLGCVLAWRASRSETQPPAFLKQLASRTGVMTVEWRPEGLPESGLQSWF
jgi:putative Mg2+ transporter-C (MgtC) family protein